MSPNLVVSYSFFVIGLLAFTFRIRKFIASQIFDLDLRVWYLESNTPVVTNDAAHTNETILITDQTQLVRF